MTFYGHTITDGGIKPIDDKVKAIRNMRTPNSGQEVLSLLGLVTYLTRFSAKLAMLTRHLRELNRKGAHFKWERRHQDVLDAVKSELCKSTTLWFYDPNPETETILQTDASLNGLGVWLRQIGTDGKERIVAMRSQALTAAESRYSNMERECLAVQWDLEKFEYYLLGRHVLIETDHAPLEQRVFWPGIFLFESVFWPGITNDIRSMVQRCAACAQHQHAQPKMPIQQPDLPTRAWSKLGTDIFECKRSQFLIIVGYYSRFPVIRWLDNIRGSTISSKFIAVLLEYGLPDVIVAAYGTQYTSEDFRKKCRDCNIELKFNSPYHHQANSIAERTIGTLKHLWKKAEQDGQAITTALFMYRTTPLSDDLLSPYELLFGRKPAVFLPRRVWGLPAHPDQDKHLESNQQRQQTQAHYYNQRHSTDRRPLHSGEPVDIYNTLTKSWDPGHVVKQQQNRSYVVNRNGKELPRTREHLRPRRAPMPPPVTNTFTRSSINREHPPEDAPTEPQTEGAPAVEPPPAPPTKPLYSAIVASPTRTRSGRVVRVPDRYTN